MALNLDQLIYSYCVERYPVRMGCCLREKTEMIRMRFQRARRIKEEVSGFPYEVQMETVKMMIEKEKNKDMKDIII